MKMYLFTFFLQEKLFVDSQERRRNTQLAINDVQVKLKSIRSELERTARGDDKYLALVTEEHSIIKEEFSLASQLENVERLEKEKFSRLTRAVRDSHEKERAQAEKTKYWSILGMFCDHIYIFLILVLFKFLQILKYFCCRLFLFSFFPLMDLSRYLYSI